MVDGQKCTMVTMRVAIFFYFCVGVALIVFGCSLLNPPSAFAPAAFVALGALNLFASMAGFWGSYNKKRVLLIFIAVGGFSTLLQVAFVIMLHTQFKTVLDAIKEHSKARSRGSLCVAQEPAIKLGDIDRNLNIMRWVALGFIFIELLTLVLACLLKWVIKGPGEYQGFTNEAHEERMLAMNTLRSDIESGGSQPKAYDKIREKMALKYGAGAGRASNDWKSKVKLSFA
ncbi:hypothetical protein QJQ45_018315 [Haematococcus lacustris]|nr:hypothetical protein QJQ45_018315 [Haematococcus lacustris]